MEAPLRVRGGFLVAMGPRTERWARGYFPRNRQVVQRGKGLRLHLPRRWGRGCFRALFWHSGRRVQVPRRRREGHLRDNPGQAGLAGRERLRGIGSRGDGAGWRPTLDERRWVGWNRTERYRGGPEGDGIEGQVRTTLRETNGQIRDL